MCVHQQELMLLLWTADPSVWNVFLTLFYWFHHLTASQSYLFYQTMLYGRLLYLL